MSYQVYSVTISDDQKNKIRKAKTNDVQVTIRISNDKLSGSDKLMLTETQIKKIEKSKKNGTGTQLTLSASQLKKIDINQLVSGGFLGSIMPAVAEAGKAMQGTYQGMLDNIKAQRERGFQKRIMTGKYDRKRARNERAMQCKEKTIKIWLKDLITLNKNL